MKSIISTIAALSLVAIMAMGATPLKAMTRCPRRPT